MSSEDASGGDWAGFRITHNPNKPANPTNLSELAPRFGEKLVQKFGAFGDFTRTGKYYEVKYPPEPDMTGLGEESLPYKAKEKSYYEKTSLADKEARKFEETKARMYAVVWGVADESARSQVARSKDFAAVDATRDDPLALWKLYQATLHLTAFMGSEEAQAHAYNAYNGLKQRDLSLSEYHRMVIVRLEAIKTLGGTVPGDAIQAINFIDRLDMKRYEELCRNIRNELRPMPKTLHDALAVASDVALAVACA